MAALEVFPGAPVIFYCINNITVFPPIVFHSPSQIMFTSSNTSILHHLIERNCMEGWSGDASIAMVQKLEGCKRPSFAPELNIF
jgi:hypothetical protein